MEKNLTPKRNQKPKISENNPCVSVYNLFRRIFEENNWESHAFVRDFRVFFVVSCLFLQFSNCFQLSLKKAKFLPQKNNKRLWWRRATPIFQLSTFSNAKESKTLPKCASKRCVSVSFVLDCYLFYKKEQRKEKIHPLRNCSATEKEERFWNLKAPQTCPKRSLLKLRLPSRAIFCIEQ